MGRVDGVKGPHSYRRSSHGRCHSWTPHTALPCAVRTLHHEWLLWTPSGTFYSSYTCTSGTVLITQLYSSGVLGHWITCKRRQYKGGKTIYSLSDMIWLNMRSSHGSKYFEEVKNTLAVASHGHFQPAASLSALLAALAKETELKKCPAATGLYGFLASSRFVASVCACKRMWCHISAGCRRCSRRKMWTLWVWKLKVASNILFLTPLTTHCSYQSDTCCCVYTYSVSLLLVLCDVGPTISRLGLSCQSSTETWTTLWDSGVL